MFNKKTIFTKLQEETRQGKIELSARVDHIRLF